MYRNEYLAVYAQSSGPLSGLYYLQFKIPPFGRLSELSVSHCPRWNSKEIEHILIFRSVNEICWRRWRY